MLKPLLLSGWFRVQPFLNSVVLVMLIAPLFAASGHSTSAQQSKVVAKLPAEVGESEAVTQETANEPDLAAMFQDAPNNSTPGESISLSQNLLGVGKQPVLQAHKIESLVVADYAIGNGSQTSGADPFAAVELAPVPNIRGHHKKGQASEIEALMQENNLASAKDSLVGSSGFNRIPGVDAIPQTPETESTDDLPAMEAPSEEQAEQVDPIGSPHPIPWKWILATQEAVGSKGSSGVRYYRSLPVVSPDGKYAVYSRVQMDVQPEMYNSRVSSTMFVEDRETKKLRVMASTSKIKDPLLRNQVAPPEQMPENGNIGVLVPVSWSEKSDRFLARKFEGVFNTGDATDHAVIWDRQKNHTNTVAPARQDDEHEKIAVLLGWSKNQPDHVLFREGEMGEEDWPLVQVATDGKTVNTNDTDQPVTFGEHKEVWSGPQVATR
ncbi:hypothetical protein H6G80_18560 [Nostoc sp. FACHB-87]|uniref:hypothetical protein n=1 Tax=Nostocaceae TaxID=1162 RepID=UPI0016890C4F|nr:MULTISPECIES: hypothetical protein [Nostocaceae]MBD2456071.1 hypothetical protein [Nostoc sp. FACHB-87]MBD2476506.1 hypothetical protein [Anabaena sp. FACHB-83]